MKKLLPYLIILPLLSGCSALSTLGNFLPGSDNGVNANAQVGKENTQAVVSTSEEISAGDYSTVSVEKIKTANDVKGTQINHNDLPWWVWVLIGWMIPAPMQIVCENIQAWKKCRQDNKANAST